MQTQCYMEIFTLAQLILLTFKSRVGG